MELVILAPLLILLVVFVLWAGRSGRAVLVADLAAGEAAVVAAQCCGDDLDDPSAADKREAAVRQVLSARPSLDFLCIGGVRPAALEDDGEFVDEALLERFQPELPGRASGVGVVGVRLECETDGAVAPLRGLFPTVSFYGQASEVIAIPPRLLISIDPVSSDPSVCGPDDDITNRDFEIRFSAPNTQQVTIEATSPSSTQEIIDEGEYFGTISIAIPCDDPPDQIEFELMPNEPCSPDNPPPALANPVDEGAEIEIQCDDPAEISTYGKPVDSNGMPRPDYWKAVVTGTIVNDDP